jgi:hypothetical protein
MREFFVGLMAILAIMLLSVAAVLLFPLVIVLGFFLKWVLSVLFIIFSIWLLGKVTLMAIDYFRKSRGEY